MPTLVSSGDITISDVNDGLNARLSNESHVIPTDADGLNGDFSGCSTTISVFVGPIDDSANWTITALASPGLTGTLAGRTYTVTALSGDIGYVDLTASKTGFPSITSRFSVSKAVAGTNGQDASQIAVVATQWDYRDDDAAWGIRINGTLQTGAARGHKLVVLNPATNTVSINQNYDTYGSVSNTDSLAAAISAVADGLVVILTTYDATQCNQNLRNALRLCGSESTETWATQRKSHAFIGQKGLPIGAAYEKTGFGTTSAGTSRVAAYFTTSGVVRNGSTAFNAVSAILSNEAHVFTASTAGVVASYVGSGTELRVYDGTVLLTYDGSGTLPGTWKFTNVASNITIGAISDSGAFATIGDHSGVADGVDTSSITYTITGKSLINSDFTLVKVQTFSKAKRGIEGDNAISVTLSNETHVFPATYTNIVSNYRNSGTEIQVLEGATELAYDAAGLTPGTWKVDTSSSNIVAGPVKKFILGDDWVFNDGMGSSGWGVNTAVTCIIWANNQFIAGGTNGKIATSSDGITWSVNENLSKTGWGDSVILDIIWTGVQYVLVGANATYSSDLSIWYANGSINSTAVATSSDGINWEYQPDLNLKTNNGALCIAWNGSKYVAGGQAGLIATSLDAKTWEISTNLSSTAWGTNVSGDSVDVLDINWNGSQFLAVGVLGRVATSPDGVTWTYQAGLTSTAWGTSLTGAVRSINWNGSQYVIVGQGGRVATSPNGITWTYQSGLASTAWGAGAIYSINWNGSQYIVVGASGKVATSPDGITWTYQSGITSVWGSSYDAFTVIWNGSKYVVGGVSGSVATSADGITWANQGGLAGTDKWLDSPVNSGTLLSRYAIIGGDGAKLAVRFNDEWEFQDAFAIKSAIDLTVLDFNGSQYIVGGTNATLAISSDGIYWTYQDGLANASWGTSATYDINWNGFQYMAVGAGGRVATSPDGITWTYQSSLASTTWATATAYSISWNGSQYVIVGTLGRVATSPDGITWTYQGGLASTTWSTATARCIVWNGSQYLVVGQSGRVATSPDGITWTYQGGLRATSWGTLDTVFDVHWNGSQYLVVGDSGKVATSPDGITWTNQTGLSSTTWGTVNEIYSIGWDGSQYVVCGMDGDIATSFDGITWKYQAGLWNTPWGALDYANSIIWDGTQFLVVGDNRKLATSVDGVNWKFKPNLSGWKNSGNVNHLANIDNTVYALGSAGNIACSNNLIDWTFLAPVGAVDIGAVSLTGIAKSANDTLCAIGSNNLVMVGNENQNLSLRLGYASINTRFFANTANKINWNGTQYLAVGNDASIATSVDGVTWVNQVGLISADWGISNINDVHWNGSQYVVVGNSGKVATSPDGITWTNQTGLSSTAWGIDDIFAVAWNGSQYIVGSNYGGIATSPDGITWTYRSGLASTTWGAAAVRAINWNGSQYLVAGASGKVATSPDGITWAYQGGLTSTTWGTTTAYFVNWNGSQYLIGGAAGRIATSPDGITWTYRSGLASTTWGSASTAIVYSINWNGSQYLVAGGSGKVATSPDGITWTYQSGLTSTAWSSSAVFSISWNGSQYLVVGELGKVASSTTGVSWVYGRRLTSTTWGGSDINDIVWNGSQYLVIGDSGKVATSTTGVSWSYQPLLQDTLWRSTNINAINWNGSQYLICGEGGAIATSPNGVTWTYQSGLTSTAWGTTAVYAINWNGSQYLIAGGSGKVATSPDGITWTNQTGLSSTAWGTNTIYSISWGGSQYVIAGNSGAIATSPNGVTWTYQGGLASTAWATSAVRSIVWNGSQYLVAGASGKVATSPNGVTWTYQGGLASTAWGAEIVYSISWNGSRYIVAGGDIGSTGKVATSSNGVTWTFADINNDSSSTPILTKSYYDGTRFILCSSGQLWFSTVGDISFLYPTWTITQALPAGSEWNTNTYASSIAWGNNVFCVVGEYGRVATSVDGNIWIHQELLNSIGGWNYSNINQVIFANGVFCIIGDYGNTAISADGITWQVSNSLVSTDWGRNPITSIVWANGKFHIFGYNGKTAFSSDGLTWQFNNKIRLTEWGIDKDIFCSFANDEIIYAGGTDGYLVFSDDFVGIEMHSDFNNGADSAVIDYLVTGYSSRNEYFSVKKQQTLSKAKTGNIATATFGVNITGQITPANASTFIANTAIGTAQIADASVETLKIAGNAVTVPASAYTAAAFTLTTTFAVIQSVVVDLQSDIPIPVIITSSFTLSGATVSQFRILRGTTVLFTSGEIVQGTDGINKPTSPISIAIGDTAPIGTSTYYLEARYVSGFTARTAATRNLTILGVKK
jgi:hypothetical protein